MIELKPCEHDKDYVVTPEGTCYNVNTPPELIAVLERCRKERTRIHVFTCYKITEKLPEFTDYNYGEAWCEDYGVLGYVGRSTGRVKIPLLVYSERSYGGGELITTHIGCVMNTKTHEVLWKYEHFHFPILKVEECTLERYSNTKNKWVVEAHCKDSVQAHRLMDFFTGKRFSK